MLHRTIFGSLLVLALVLTASAADAQAWAGRGRAQGVVKGPDGRPLEGAQVTLHKDGTEPGEGPEPVLTNEKGRWLAAGLGGGAWTAVIEKEGFVAAQGPVYVNEFGTAQSIEVVLHPSPFASIDVGDQLLDEGRYEEARAEYEKALPELEPDGAARLRSRIGDTYLAQGEWAKAREQYQQALQHIPPEEQAHILLQMATSYDQEGNLAAARGELEKVLPLLPPDNQAQILLMIARTHDAEDDRAAAIAALERACQLSPEDPAILQLLADLLSREGRDEEAEAYLARLPEEAELPADMLLNVGIRHYNEGDMDTALANFDRAVRQSPDLADAYYYRGLVRVSRQDSADAIADLEKYLELAPEGEHAAEARDFLSYLREDA